MLALFIWPLLILTLCLAGYGLGFKKRGLEFWPFGLALGAALFVSVFHLTRYLLNIPFNTSAITALGAVLAIAIFGAFRIRLMIPRVSRAFLVNLGLVSFFCLLILLNWSGWDMSHHLPGAWDLMANIHPSATAQNNRPDVAGGFYHYGVESLVAVGTWLSGGRGARYLFRLTELCFAIAGFWILLKVYTKLLGDTLGNVSAALFFWAGDLMVFLNLYLFFTGNWSLPLMLIPVSTARCTPAPVPHFFTYAFQPPMNFGFPLFLTIIWLSIRGGKLRNTAAGFLVGPLLVMQVFLGVSAGMILWIVPFIKWWIEKRFSPKNLLAPASALVSALATGIPIVVIGGGGQNLWLGPYWIMALLPSSLTEIILGPIIYLGLPFIFALFGAFLAIRGKLLPRDSMFILGFLALTGLMVPQVFGYPDFVKFFLLASLGYSPFAGITLIHLWRKGGWGRACVVASAVLMSVTSVAFLILRWLAYISHKIPGLIPLGH